MDSETRKEVVEKILVSVPDYIQKVRCDTNQWTPPFKCAVSSCRNCFLSFEERDEYSYKFHNFPHNQDLSSNWKEQCGIPQNTDISGLKVCSDHFSLDDYIRNYREEFLNPNFKRKLKSQAIPQRNLNVSNAYMEPSSASLNLNEIQKAEDENERLRNKYKTLVNAVCNIKKKITIYEKKKAYKYNIKNKKNVVCKVFSDAQINLLIGKKKVIWSDDDLAKAFTLRHIGSKECYLYLKNKLNMPLPALACVQKWAASCNMS